MQMDTWMSEQIEEGVLTSLADIPLSKRKSIVIGMMKQMPKNPNSWVKACLRNFHEQVFERQVTGGASPNFGMRPNGTPPSVPSPYQGMQAGQPSHGSLMQGPPLSSISESMVRQITGRGREGPLSPVVTGTPDKWVHSAWTLWQNNKSHFCAEIHSQLGEVVRGRFQGMPARDQLHIGFGLMLAASTGMDLDQLVNSWCDRYDALSNGIVLTPAPTTAATSSPSQLSVQFILCGGVLASSNVLTWVAMQCVGYCRPDLRIDLMPVIEVGYREVDVRVARAVFNAQACLARSDAGVTPGGLNDAITGFLQEWKQKKPRSSS